MCSELYHREPQSKHKEPQRLTCEHATRKPATIPRTQLNPHSSLQALDPDPPNLRDPRNLRAKKTNDI